MDDQVTQKVVQLLKDRFVAPTNREKITPDTPLLSSGLGLDSVAVLELVMEVEKEFAVTFADADLSVDLFKSPRTLARAVEGKLGPISGPSTPRVAP